MAYRQLKPCRPRALAWTGTATLAAAAMSSVLAGSASATAIKYNPAPTTNTGWNACGTALVAGLAGDNCKTTAFFEKDSLSKEFQNNPGGVSVIFGAGFNAWNNNNNSTLNPAATTPQGWTLINGGDPGGTLNVTKAKAVQLGGVSRGGAQIFITPSIGLLTTLNTDVAIDNALAPAGKKDYKITWAQGLYDNFVLTPNPATGPAFYEMDVSAFTANTAGNDPSYCAGFSCPGGTSFEDTPNFRYLTPGSAQAFFFGNTYISIYSLANKSLTVYDGVDYGWHNFVSRGVPEPSTWAVMLLGLGGLGAAVRARRRASVA
jgi:PEP-CTERM motif